jgi:coenzyme F420-reducing hydrogenase beta subunit
LEGGHVDGALVCETAIVDGRVRARYAIAESAERLAAAQGSTYVLGDFVGEAIPLIEAYRGRLAVVGLPCELEILSRRRELADTVALRVALFCGHATRPELVDALVEHMAPAVGAELVAFRFRRGHWRGAMRAEFSDGTVVERPFSTYGLYQNLYLFSAKKCLFCADHFGYAADLCAGDVWTYELQDDPIKHTALVAKSKRGLSAVDVARGAQHLIAEGVSVSTVLDGQRRIAPFHRNVTARSKAGRRLGMKIPDRGQPVRWHEYLAARIAIRNYLRTLEPDAARAVLGRPRLLWKLQLWVLKGLESLS